MVISLRGLAAAAVVGVLLCSGSTAQSERPAPERYVLENGLEVVLLPDHRVPKAALALVYKVGSINEPVGRSGFAHLFEHLMFSGTPAWPEFDVAYAALGLENNAFTTEDQTVYWGEGLASALPVMLSIEADRMANLGNDVDQAELDIQRDVVLNEMRQKVLDSPGSAASEAMQTGLFAKPHPYSRAVIGSIPDLEAAQVEDVRAFFNTFYVPNNAVLVLVGDFEVEATKALVAETLGLVPRGAEVSTLPYQPVAPAKLDLDLEDRVPFEQVMLGFTGPPYAETKENAALWIAGELLGNYEYGVLRTDLVNTGLAAYAFAGWAAGQLGGRFMVGAATAGGVKAEDLEAALRTTLADFTAKPIDPADFERARANYVLSDRVAMEGYLSRALTTAVVAGNGGDISRLFDDLRGFRDVTVADVEAALRKILVLDDASTVVLRPGARGTYPAVLAESSGEAVPIASGDRPPVAVPVLGPGEPGLADMPAAQSATLSNGIDVVHYQVDGAPMLYVAASVSGGTTNDPHGKKAFYGMALAMASRGAGERDLDAFSKAAKDLGADISGTTGDQRSAVLLAVPPENFGAALPLFADAILRPRFDEAAWSVMVQEMVSGMMQRDIDLGSLAGMALDNQLFPSADGASVLYPSVESVATITREEAKAAFHEMFVPATMTFYSVGGLALADVVAGLEGSFGDWTGEGAGIPSKPFPSPEFPASRRVFFVPDADATQAILSVARPAPGFDDPTQPEAVAVTRLLGGDFLSRLNTVIREEKGYSYGVDAGLWQSLRDRSALTVSSAVERDVAGLALDEIFAGFSTLETVPVTESELNRSVTSYLSSIASTAETAESLAGWVLASTGSGFTVDELLASQVEMTKLSLDDVRAQAKLLADLDQSIVVVAGDPDVILPQLAAIGLTDVVTLPRSP